MASPSSLASIKWRPVVGLMVAGLLGWLLAWLVLPQAPIDLRNANNPVGNMLPIAPLQAPTSPALPSGGLPFNRSAEPAAQRPGLETLLRQQAKVSESAADTVARMPVPTASALAAMPAIAASKPNFKRSDDPVRAAKLKALVDLRTNAMLELQSVPPNDTRRMMAIIEKFDAQLRATGAPAVLDLESLRKTLESANRLSDLSQQMQAEADKGKAADVGKLQAMSQEMQALQKAMPRQVYRPDVLRQVLSQ